MEYHPLTEAEKREICTWKYEGAYAIYDSAPYEEQRRSGKGLFNPRNDLFAFRDGEKLIGYINLFEDGDEVFFGIGAAPDCCGRGYGQKMAAAALSIAKELFGDKPLHLEVRTWNARAIRCYEKAGFRVDGEPFTQTTPIGTGEFCRMVKAPASAFWENSWSKIDPARVAAYVGSLDPSPDTIIQYLLSRGAKTVCDAGCGCGAYAAKLCFFGFSVSGFDLSPAAVRLAQALLAERGFATKGFRAADISETGFPNSRFDAVVARDVLDHLSLKSARRTAAELLRIAKPGGCVVLTLDAADEEYESEPHVLSPDGDYLYTDGKRCGMVFHPYTPETLSPLFPGRTMRLLASSETGFTAAFQKEN